MSGGRYADLGVADEDSPQWVGNVYRGGTRQIKAQSLHTGYPGFADDHTIAISETFAFAHAVAPLGKKSRSNPLAWEFIDHEITTTYICG